MKLKSLLSKFKMLDYVIVISLIAISCVLIFKPSDARAKKLVIMYKYDEIVLPFKNDIIDLSKDFQDIYYNTHNIGENILVEVVDGSARVIEADCPDHVCMNMGWATNCGDMVICMPNSTALLVDCTGALSEGE